MKPASARNPEIIRMFPDYADTVLWLDGSVDYADTGLGARLVEELQGWERYFYASLNGDCAFRSADREQKYRLEGIRLAQLVCMELGQAHAVEFLEAKREKLPTLFRSDRRATNPTAAKCFDDLVEAKLEFMREAKAAQADGSYYAYAPLSGAVFDPQGILDGPGKSRQRRK